MSTGGEGMDFIRIGDKLISREKLYKVINRILELRADGMSQQEVAQETAIDRSFVSRLEGLGEVRKGGRIALIGFPVSNKEDLLRVGEDEGCDFIFLMTNEERWRWVDRESGVDLLNQVMSLIAKVKDFESVILIGSDMRIRLVEAIMSKDIISISLGESPIKEDKYVDPEHLRSIIRKLRE
jgi:predicted XRE-type DNA-binding protein